MTFIAKGIAAFSDYNEPPKKITPAGHLKRAESLTDMRGMSMNCFERHQYLMDIMQGKVEVLECGDGVFTNKLERKMEEEEAKEMKMDLIRAKDELRKSTLDSKQQRRKDAEIESLRRKLQDLETEAGAVRKVSMEIAEENIVIRQEVENMKRSIEGREVDWRQELEYRDRQLKAYEEQFMELPIMEREIDHLKRAMCENEQRWKEELEEKELQLKAYEDQFSEWILMEQEIVNLKEIIAERQGNCLKCCDNQILIEVLKEQLGEMPAVEEELSDLKEKALCNCCKCADLTNEINILREQQREYPELEKELETLRGQSSRYEGPIAGLEKRSDDQKTTTKYQFDETYSGKDLQEEITRLNKALKDLQLAKDEEIETLKEEITKLQQQLEQYAVDFKHVESSLKVIDIVPEESSTAYKKSEVIIKAKKAENEAKAMGSDSETENIQLLGDEGEVEDESKIIGSGSKEETKPELIEVDQNLPESFTIAKMESKRDSKVKPNLIQGNESQLDETLKPMRGGRVSETEKGPKFERKGSQTEDGLRGKQIAEKPKTIDRDSQMEDKSRSLGSDSQRETGPELAKRIIKEEVKPKLRTSISQTAEGTKMVERVSETDSGPRISHNERSQKSLERRSQTEKELKSVRRGSQTDREQKLVEQRSLREDVMKEVGRANEIYKKSALSDRDSRKDQKPSIFNRKSQTEKEGEPVEKNSLVEEGVKEVRRASDQKPKILERKSLTDRKSEAEEVTKKVGSEIYIKPELSQRDSLNDQKPIKFRGKSQTKGEQKPAERCSLVEDVTKKVGRVSKTDTKPDLSPRDGRSDQEPGIFREKSQTEREPKPVVKDSPAEENFTETDKEKMEKGMVNEREMKLKLSERDNKRGQIPDSKSASQSENYQNLHERNIQIESPAITSRVSRAESKKEDIQDEKPVDHNREDADTSENNDKEERDRAEGTKNKGGIEKMEASKEGLKLLISPSKLDEKIEPKRVSKMKTTNNKTESGVKSLKSNDGGTSEVKSARDETKADVKPKKTENNTGLVESQKMPKTQERDRQALDTNPNSQSRSEPISKAPERLNEIVTVTADPLKKNSELELTIEQLRQESIMYRKEISGFQDEISNLKKKLDQSLKDKTALEKMKERELDEYKKAIAELQAKLEKKTVELKKSLEDHKRELSEREKFYKESLNALKADNSAERSRATSIVEDTHSKVEKLAVEHEETLRKTIESHKSELAEQNRASLKAIKALKSKYEKERTSVSVKTKDSLTQLQADHSRELQAMKAEMDRMQQANEEVMKEVFKRHAQELESVRKMGQPLDKNSSKEDVEKLNKDLKNMQDKYEKLLADERLKYKHLLDQMKQALNDREEAAKTEKSKGGIPPEKERLIMEYDQTKQKIAEAEAKNNEELKRIEYSAHVLLQNTRKIAAQDKEEASKPQTNCLCQHGR